MSDRSRDNQGFLDGGLGNTNNTIDIYKKHGLKGLIFVLAFGLRDPSQSLTGGILETIVPKIIEFTNKRPRLTQISGYLAAFCFLMTFVPSLVNDFWLWSREHMYASVAIDKFDCGLYGNFMDFIVSKAVFRTRRSLLAQSHDMHKNETRHYNGDNDDDQSTSDQLVFFKGTSNRMQFFRHHGQSFLFTNEKKDPQIKLWCFGSSPKPIENLLLEIQKSAETQKQETHIKVFAVENGEWVEQASVKRREIESVFMDTELKRQLMNDLEVFLKDGAEKWYDQRGANYRRGYLFHGKPGCGKTSFIKAIASHFGMYIYTLSLTDKSIDDNVLASLFKRLQKGDLLVLEDIDCAGLLKRTDETEKQDANDADDADSGYNSLEEQIASLRLRQDAKRAKKHKRGVRAQNKQANLQQLAQDIQPKAKPEIQKREEPKPEPPTKVTLSGLLNTMDGISSSTGYVLIMTTNKPQALDEAVGRAGRIEKIFEFSNITRETAREMFKFYFQPIDEEQCSYDLDSVPKLAVEFAERLPENELSPAQIQSYLLRYPSAPAEAVQRMPKWIQEERERAKTFGN
ncbi:hypothetical protein LTR70_006801 [Exophiala xenobiotica]|uniref:Mitochondrial chaperone BCS1 n=1 Tax=Lithohypha guttulata TaxID=1690604 RepID=A0ABR0K683_9EURO|nr:hypothetical protein LTR24_006344 [Lithohypha guttulata]KAK5315370.1 hypothetical protein LTR70_006801 [Exophiala xenobiotica]